jgi:quercetin dioxygenase-like cupin family protein
MHRACVTIRYAGVEKGRTIVNRIIAFAFGAVFAIGGVGAVAADELPDFIRVTPETIHWMPLPHSPGVMAAILAGNPSTPGPYVIRIKFPPHVMDRPHFHSSDRYVTVLKGTWYAGTGKRFDPSSAVLTSTGSYMFHPAGGVHWDGSNSSEEVIVQITGVGPVTTTQVDPSAAEWVNLSNAASR